MQYYSGFFCGNGIDRWTGVVLTVGIMAKKTIMGGWGYLGGYAMKVQFKGEI